MNDVGRGGSFPADEVELNKAGGVSGAHGAEGVGEAVGDAVAVPVAGEGGILTGGDVVIGPVVVAGGEAVVLLLLDETAAAAEVAGSGAAPGADDADTR